MIFIYQKILVINMMHIGDLLVTTPFLHALRNSFPKSHIALLADDKLKDLVVNNRNIDELILIKKKGYHNKLSNYIKFVKEIRKKNFDLVINLHANERASFCAAFSKGKKIVGYSTFGPHLMFDKLMKNRNKIKHQVEAHFDVLREHLDISEIADNGIDMWLDEKSQKDADLIWQEAFGAEKVKAVALNIGASWPTKRWRYDYYAELADKLLDLGYGVIYLGGDMDKEVVDKAISLMKNKDHDKLKVFTGKLTLFQLAAVLRKCDCLVTNDSGPMHIAVAMDVPLVAMFGPSPVLGFYPYNDKSISIKTPVDCYACGQHNCDTLECMTKIPVDVVLKYALELIEKYSDLPKPLSRENGKYQCQVIEL